MDIRAYKKENVYQPAGQTSIVKANIIDLIPVVDTIGGTEYITGAEVLETDRELLSQECALATIWQRGLDPLDLESGIRWSEALLGEVSVLELMGDITDAVAAVSLSMEVAFGTITDANGVPYLSYSIKETV